MTHSLVRSDTRGEAALHKLRRRQADWCMYVISPRHSKVWVGEDLFISFQGTYVIASNLQDSCENIRPQSSEAFPLVASVSLRYCHVAGITLLFQNACRSWLAKRQHEAGIPLLLHIATSNDFAVGLASLNKTRKQLQSHVVRESRHSGFQSILGNLLEIPILNGLI